MSLRVCSHPILEVFVKGLVRKLDPDIIDFSMLWIFWSRRSAIMWLVRGKQEQWVVTHEQQVMKIMCDYIHYYPNTRGILAYQ